MFDYIKERWLLIFGSTTKDITTTLHTYDYKLGKWIDGKYKEVSDSAKDLLDENVYVDYTDHASMALASITSEANETLGIIHYYFFEDGCVRIGARCDTMNRKMLTKVCIDQLGDVANRIPKIFLRANGHAHKLSCNNRGGFDYD